MAGDRTHSQRRAAPADSGADTAGGRAADPPAPQEWYVLTDGASALRISAGLTVGEASTGALTLNDPATRHQWIELVISDSGDPWVAIVTREKSLRVDGATHMRYRLAEGTALQLPNNTLYISRDIRMPRPSGVVIEVVPRDVPGRAQDLMGPEWAQAIAAIREPPAASGPSLEDELEPEDGVPYVESADTADEPEAESEPRSETVGVAESRDASDDFERTRVFEPPRRAQRRSAEAPTEFDPRPSNGRRATVTEPRRGSGYRRRSRRRGRATALFATVAVVGLALGGLAAVVFTLYGPLWPMADSDRQRSFVDVPLDRVPDGPGVARTPAAADDPSWQDPLAQSTVDQDPVREEPVREEPVRQDPVAREPDRFGTGADPALAAVPGSGPSPEAGGSAAPDPLVATASGRDAAPELRGDVSPTSTEVPVDPQARAGSAQTPAPQSRSGHPASVAPSRADAGVPIEEQVAVLPRREPAPNDRTQAPAQPAPASTVSTNGPLDWRLVRARELLDEGYITFPPRDNAVDYVQRLLADDPGNRQALAMLQLCSDRLIEAAMRAHDQGMDYEARNTLEEVFGFDPQNERAKRLWREWVGPR